MKKNCFVLAGLFLAVLGFKIGLLPLNVNIGGFAGIGQILNHCLGIPFAVTSALLNGALFLWAAKNEGWKSVIRAIVTTAVFSTLLDWIPTIVLPNMSVYHEWLLLVIAGISTGCGFGLILRGNATTGGSDYLGKLIVKLFPAISMGTACTMINLSIVAATAVLFGLADLVQAFLATVIVNESVNITLYIKSNRPLPASLRYLHQILQTFRRECRSHSTASISKPNISTSSFQEGQILILCSGSSTIKLQVVSVTCD